MERISHFKTTTNTVKIASSVCCVYAIGLGYLTSDKGALCYNTGIFSYNGNVSVMHMHRFIYMPYEYYCEQISGRRKMQACMHAPYALSFAIWD